MTAETRIVISARDQASHVARRTSTEFRQLGQAVTALGTAFAGVQIGQFVMEVYQASAHAEQLRATFEVVAGGAQGAADEFAFLRDEADRLGLNFWDLAEAESGFLAATKESNLGLQERREIFSSVMEAGVALGRSNEEIKGTLYAMEQMLSKGTVSMEELRQQLGDRLPGAFAMAARSMGVTTSELADMVENGEVLAEDLLPKLTNLLHEAYGTQAEEMSNSLTRRLDKLREAYTDVKVAFSETLPMQAAAASIWGVTKALKGMAVMINLLKGNKADGSAMTDLDRAHASVGRLRKELQRAEEQLRRMERYSPGTPGLEAMRENVDLLRDSLNAAERKMLDLQGERRRKAWMDEHSSGSRHDRNGSDHGDDDDEGNAKAVARDILAVQQWLSSQKIALIQDEYERRRAMIRSDAEEQRTKAHGDLELLARIGQTEQKQLAELEADRLIARLRAQQTYQRALMSASEREIAEVRDRYAELRTLAAEDSAARIELARQRDEEIRAIEEAAWERSLEGSDSMAAGIVLGARRVRQEMGSLATDISGVWVNATQEMGRAFGTMLTDTMRQEMDDFSDYFEAWIWSIASAMNNMLGQRVASGLMSGIGGLFGGFSGGSSGSKGTINKFHSGGVVGRDVGSGTARLPASTFADAPRYHGGGLVGLAPDERPIIARIGEEVITASDPRHRDNHSFDSARVQINFSVVAMDAASFRQQLAANKAAIVGIVQQAYNRRGRPGPLDHRRG